MDGIGFDDGERDLARAHVRERITEPTEHQRGLKFAFAEPADVVMQLLDRPARDEQRHDEHNSEGDEAEGEPRAQSHVGIVRKLS